MAENEVLLLAVVLRLLRPPALPRTTCGVLATLRHRLADVSTPRRGLPLDDAPDGRWLG